MTKVPSNITPDLLRNACLSADGVAIGFTGTPAEKTRVIIQRALEALEANGLITVTPAEEWPPLYMIDPPYKLSFGSF